MLIHGRIGIKVYFRRVLFNRRGFCITVMWWVYDFGDPYACCCCCYRNNGMAFYLWVKLNRRWGRYIYSSLYHGLRGNCGLLTPRIRECHSQVEGEDDLVFSIKRRSKASRHASNSHSLPSSPPRLPSPPNSSSTHRAPVPESPSHSSGPPAPAPPR